MVASPQRLHEFVNFRLQYIKGKEKSEAQTFLDRLFKAFGHKGALQAGAKYEVPVEMASRKGKTGYVDLAWTDLIIEMKSQGENLTKHYRQIYDYWAYFRPKRPKYCILCNFDEFWIYDFETQPHDPVDTIPLTKLPQRASAFGFMEVQQQTPIFANNQIEITQKTARKMGELCEILKQRGRRDAKFSVSAAQRLVLQCVLAMFAEDRGLLPHDMFLGCVRDCLDGKSSYDVLGGLFAEMNRPGITPAGRYKGVDYFNGGLFATIHPIELTKEELTYLDEAARENWQQVRPAIFGNILEGTADRKKRHACGMHFTSEADIMKIVKPTISDYWKEKIDRANTIAQLNSLQIELQNYRVLDPACGSGNFLYIAYQELKQIEQELLTKIASRRKSKTNKGQGQISLVTPGQFYGIDINPFAVELAKVTLTIAKKVAIDRLELTEKDLPLDTLDNNIICDDALFTDWIRADAIIGNPPFLGGKHMRLNLGDDYVEKVFQQFPSVKDVDFCSYWFRLASDNAVDNNYVTRIGLVGTNSIAQGKTRKATLDYITQNKGYIHNAISTQPWSGEAKVHVSIVNWNYQQPQQYVLDDKPVNFINSSLTTSVDVSQVNKLKANKNKGFQGIIPVGKGFYISQEQADEWIEKDASNKDVLKQSCSADDLTDKVNGNPSRWIIDFNDMCLEDASDYKLPFEHLKNTVKPERDNNRDKKAKQYWWKFLRSRPAMRKAINGLSCYFIVPSHSKWFIFLPADPNWLPNNSTTVITSDDFYVLGILTSNVHRLWVQAQSSTLKADTRYTHTTCFETFPFPQYDCKGEQPFAPTGIIQKIRDKTTELHQYRTQQMEKKQWGITQLYNQYFHEPASKLYRLHQQLDKLVMQAYNFQPDDDILSQLLALNLELAAKEKRG